MDKFIRRSSNLKLLERVDNFKKLSTLKDKFSL